MATTNAQGCAGWAVAGVLALALISRCGDDPPQSSSAPSVLPTTGEPDRAVIHYRYVQASNLNCRAGPATSAAIVDRLTRNSHVGVLETRSGWSLVDRDSDCWVSDAHLGGSRHVAPAATPQRFASVGGRSAYYRNCSAARAAGAAPVYRGEPGYARHLDRDNDGVGCE
jgi:hypothetical protein